MEAEQGVEARQGGGRARWRRGKVEAGQGGGGARWRQGKVEAGQVEAGQGGGGVRWRRGKVVYFTEMKLIMSLGAHLVWARFGRMALPSSATKPS